MTEWHPAIQQRLDRIANKAYTPEAKERVGMIMTAGMNNDQLLLATLGSTEQFTWHEGRKIADPSHCNPYIMADRRKL